MPACVEFHTDGQGDLLVDWRKQFPSIGIEDVDEIDVYDTTADILIPECKLVIDAYDTLMGCLPMEEDKPWNVYIDFSEYLNWDERKGCIVRTHLQRGIWKDKRFHGWPTYLEGAELSDEFIIGEGLPAILSEGIKTEFPAGEEGYGRMFALAKVGIDKLYELWAEYSSGFFLSKSDDLLDPSFMEELFWVSETGGRAAFPSRAKFLLDRDCVFPYHTFFPGIRPYNEYMILAKRGILMEPAYKFPPADRSMFD